MFFITTGFLDFVHHPECMFLFLREKQVCHLLIIFNIKIVMHSIELQIHAYYLYLNMCTNASEVILNSNVRQLAFQSLSLVAETYKYQAVADRHTAVFVITDFIYLSQIILLV
jgi:hypothetical protein